MIKRTFLIFPILFFLAGCGPRKASLLNKLRLNMTKQEVRKKMGAPDIIHCPKRDKDGNVIDFWEYNLAIVDRNKEAKSTALQIGGWLFFWPLLCFPSAWESPYDYDVYFLKFVNDFLKQWGGSWKFREKSQNITS